MPPSLVKEIYHLDGIDLRTTIPETQFWMMGNLGRIEQVLMNLISNAKDAVEKSKVKRIDIALRSAADDLEIRVADTGSGIPENVQHRIFDTFFTTKEVGQGTGMGLSLTLAIVKEHRGTISFQTSSDGTVFVLRFPRTQKTVIPTQTNADVAAPATPARTKSSQPLKVLVVDDEDGLREILIDLLQERDCLVHEAANGVDAMVLLRANSYDLVLTDLKMPKMDGEELLRSIHRECQPRPKLIVITGGVATDLTGQAPGQLSTLIDGFLLKPFEDAAVDEILSDFKK